MPDGTKMYQQRAKNSNFSDFDDTRQSSCMVKYYIFFIWPSDGFMCNNYLNLASSLLLGINGLIHVNFAMLSPAKGH